MFAPGDTISAGAQAGTFYVDTNTGAAEGWVAASDTPPDVTPPYALPIGRTCADRASYLYKCDRPVATYDTSRCAENSGGVWYLFGATLAMPTRLDSFVNPQISPDGATLFGATAVGLAFADAPRPDALRPLTLPRSADTRSFSLNWSPDGTRFVLTDASERQFLVRVSDGLATPLGLWSGARWLDNGRKLGILDSSGGGALGDLKIAVLDRDGGLLWTKVIPNAWGSGVWSGDGTLLYLNQVERRTTSQGSGALLRIDVIDANTGLTAYRLRGMFCEGGWVADTHQIITYSWAPVAQVLVDLDTRTVRELTAPHGALFPTPLDRTRAILSDGTSLSWYDLSTGRTTLIARTDRSVIWDPVVGTAFAGDHLVLRGPIRGHGGCLEGSAPANPPKPQVLVGPFADDAPVIRGVGH